MKCPKCNHDNPDGVLFCDECDWRVDQPYKRESSIPRMYFPLFSAIFGAVSLVAWYLAASSSMMQYVAIILGATGMVFGGYSTSFIRITKQDKRMPLMILAMAGILLSVVGFMLGLILLTE